MKMLHLNLLLWCLLISSAVSDEHEDRCRNALLVDGKLFEREVLKDEIDRPYSLNVLKSNNYLYYSYGDNEPKVAHINLNSKNKDSEEVAINDAFATAVDQANNVIYIGTDSGIYKHDPKTKNHEVLPGISDNIWSMFFKEKLFYVTYPDYILHAYENEESSMFPDLDDDKVDQFAIDKNDTVYLYNTTGLYAIEKLEADETREIPLEEELYSKTTAVNGQGEDVYIVGDGKTLRITEKGKTKETLLAQNLVIRDFALNNNGKVHFAGTGGIYTLNDDNKVMNIAEIPEVYGLTFDKFNRLIYSDENSIAKLKPNTDC